MGKRWTIFFFMTSISVIISGHPNLTPNSSESPEATLKAETITSLFSYGSIQAASPATLYTYQSGSWDNIDVWTTDPGGTTLVGSKIPEDGDDIVVLPSRTLTLSYNITNTGLGISIQEGGILDMSVYTFTTLSSLSGKGTIKLKSNIFPDAIVNTFVSIGGGTTVYYNDADFILPVTQTIYNNLTINSSAFTATQLGNITLNGNLRIQSGTYKINDESAARRTLIIYGDVSVNAGSSISIGTGNTTSTSDPTSTGTGGTAPFLDYYVTQAHRVEVYGNFTNNGTVRFTNQSFPVFNAFPDNGIASVFFRGSSNSTLTCSGTTDFYNIIIDKGSDQTYILTLNSAGYDKFRLFGANNASEFAGSNASNPNIRKALWIRTGTLKLNGYVFIPSLVEGSASGSGDFFIPGNGALVMDGPDVVVMGTIDDYSVVNLAYGISGGSGEVNGVTTDPSAGPSNVSLYGKMQLNDGHLYVGEMGRIIYHGTATAEFVINGGTIDIKQFQSVSGGGKTAYWQTGGDLILRGRFKRTLLYSDLNNLISSIGNITQLNTARATSGTDLSVGTLNIDQDANVFHMEGGNINIYDVSGSTGTPRALEINSDPVNVDVTGGNISVFMTAGTVVADAGYGIASKAPLYNLNITRNTGTQSSILLSVPAKAGVTAVTNPPLTVLNNLTISDLTGSVNAVLNASNFDVKAGGNLTIQSNAEYTPGTNRTILNGEGDQAITNNGTILGGGLNKFFIDKNSGIATLGTNITVRDSLAIIGGTLDDGGFTLQVAGNIYNAGTHTGTGKIVLNAVGSGSQRLTASVSGTPAMGNIEVNSTTTNAVAAILGSDFSIYSLALTSNKIFDIGSNRLTIGAGGIASATFGTARMIRTAGQSSDGGLRMTVDASTLTTGNVKLFPIGVSGKYTPAEINGNTTPGTGTGLVTFIPVNALHPAATAGRKQLKFYWKSKSSGMPSVSNVYYTLTDYHGGDWEGGINSGYVLLTGATIWESGGSAVNPVVNINGIANSNGFISADITAGNNAAFNNIIAYYSIGSGPWNTNIWSNISHTGASCNCQPDEPSDIIYIGGRSGQNDSIWLPAGTYNVAYLNINGSYTGDQQRPVLNLQGNGGNLTVDIINGAGKLSSSSNVLTAGATDLGGLLNNDSAMVHFYGAAYTLPSSITSYPNLLITGGNTKVLPAAEVVVRRNLKILDHVNSNNALSLNGVSGNLTVFGDVEFQNGSRLIIPASATVRNINIYGKINFRYGNTNDVNAIQVTSGAGTNHKFNFYGSTIISGASNLSFNPSGTNKLDLYLKNHGPTIITEGTGTFGLNRLFIQKDILSDTVYFKNNFTLNETGNSTTAKSLTLSTGTLVLSDPANGSASTTNLNLSSGGTNYFNIPSTSSLILLNGSRIYITGNTSGSGIRLDGRLQAGESSEINLADGGGVNTGYIEYTGSGNAAISLSGSAVLKAAQVRRSLSLTTGILSYTQDGTSSAIYYGTGSAGIIDPSRAKFEVTGTGSAFNMSGSSSLYIINGGGTLFGDLYLRPEISTVTGGDIVLGEGINSQSFRIDASVPLNNLTILTTGAANDVQLMVNQLVLNGNLKLSDPASTLTTNGINVIIKGDFVNNGIYNAGINTTIFSGNTQSFSGANDPIFNNLTVSPLVKLSLGRDITVNNTLNITGGILEAASFNLTVKGNVINNGAHSSSPSPSTGRLYLNGTLVQHIAGSGSFGRIELDNVSGAILDNKLTLSENLTLTNGLLDINQYMLTLGPDSYIAGAGYGVSKMIKSDGVYSNGGIVKYFNAGYTGAFVYPAGVSGKYTPAILTVNSTASGSVRINIINEKHPATLSPYNVLNYYWEAESSISGFEGNLTFNYVEEDVTGNESQYVAARLIIPPGTGWSKAASGFTTDNVDEIAHTISFDFPTGTTNLGGQYTAGYDSDLPTSIPAYTSNVVSGNWDSPDSWLPAAPAGGPNGFAVIINPGHTIYTNGNKRFSYKLTINGTLDAGTTYGHNLGTVDGTGKLSLQQANLPAGDFSSFLNCSGGTLEYGGTSNYTIVADRIDTVKNLLFTGTGTRTLPDKDLTICNLLLIDGPTLDNHFNRKLIIGGSFDLTAGVFLSGSGSGATVAFKGTIAQSVTGFNAASPLNNLEIDNSAGLTLGSLLEMNGNLLLTNGLINTSAVNILKMISQLSIVTPAGGSLSSYVNGPMSKSQFGGSDFTFPIGKASRYGKITLLNPQTGTWESEYYNIAYSDLSVTGMLWNASSTEYWRVTSPADGKTAVVQLRWDSQSDITPLTTTGGINDIRVAEYNGTDWAEKTSLTPTGDDTNGTVRTSANIVINNTGNPQYYTLGSISIVKPTITLGTTPTVCNGTTSGLLPYISTTGNPDQYIIDFDAAASAEGFIDVLSWTSLPASPIVIVVPSGTTSGTYNAAITVRTSVPVNQSLSYPFTITINSDQLWTGAINSDWNLTGNWSCGYIPDLTTPVRIPDVPNKPLLNIGATGSVKDLTIDAGSSLTISGNTLQIAGTIISNGIFNAASGKIELNGSAAQAIGADVFEGNTIEDLTINNLAGVIIQGPLNITGMIMLQNGNLSSDGNLTLISSPTGTALINGSGSGQLTGNVTMQRYLPSGYGYKYFSSPFQAATVSEFSDDMNLASPFTPFYAYDENRNFSGIPASGWVSYNTPTNILNPVAGYSINFGSDASPKTIDVTGVVSNGNISVNLYNNNNPYTKGFNLIGNPYPSAIDWDAPGWTKTEIDNALYYFKASSTDQYGGTYSSYINGISSDGIASNIIPSMQGFFVHVSDGAYPVTGTLAMDNSVRITDMTHSFLKKSVSLTEKPLVRLSAGYADDLIFDPFVFYFDEKATNDFDHQLDALKFFNTDMKVPNFYAFSENGSRLSVSALPVHGGAIPSIPLGLRTRKNGEVIFKIKEIEGNLPSGSIYLYDATTETSHNLTNSDYKIFLSTGDYNSRFFLNFENLTTTVHDGESNLQPFVVYYSRNTLNAEINCLTGNKGTLRIDNLTGQTLFFADIHDNGHYEFNPLVKNGVYIVSFITGRMRFSQKIFIEAR